MPNFVCPRCGDPFTSKQGRSNHLRLDASICESRKRKLEQVQAAERPFNFFQQRVPLGALNLNILDRREAAQAALQGPTIELSPQAAARGLDERHFAGPALLNEEDAASDAADIGDPFWEAAEDGYEEPRPALHGLDAAPHTGRPAACDHPADGLTRELEPTRIDWGTELGDFITNCCQGQGLPNADADWLLRIVLHEQYSGAQVRERFHDSRTFRQWQDIPRIDKDGFLVENMRRDGDQQDLLFRYKPALDLIRKMVADPALRGRIKWVALKLFNKKGDRCITDTSSANWMVDLQAAIPPFAVPLAVACYSDKTCTSSDNRTSCRPGVLTIKNIDPELQHIIGIGSELGAMFPELQENAELGFIKGSPAFVLRNAVLNWQCLTTWLGPLIEASSTGLWLSDCDGRRILAYPRLQTYPADIQEHNAVALVRAGRCMQCMCPHSDLNLCKLRSHPPRTEEATSDLVEWADWALRSGDRDAIAEAKERLQEFGIPFAMKGPLWGSFRRLNVPAYMKNSFTAFVPDPLHGIDTGVWPHLITCLRRWIKQRYNVRQACRLIREVDRRLRLMPRHPYFRVPRRGNYMAKDKQFKAFEQRNVMQVFVLAVQGLFVDEDGNDPVCALFVSFLDWYMELTRRNRPQYHTEETLRKTDRQGIRFGRRARKLFGRQQKSRWRILKFHQVVAGHYTTTIVRFGLLLHNTTEPGEGSHKVTVKKPSRASNQRNASAQIVRSNQRRRNVAEMVSFCGGRFVKKAPKPKPTSASEKALSTGTHVLLSEKITFRWSWLRGGAAEDLVGVPRAAAKRAQIFRRLKDQPELRELERRTRVFLAGGGHGLRGNARLLDNLPNCAKSEIHVAPAAAIAPGRGARYQPVLTYARATLSFFGEPYFTDVAIRAPAGDRDGPEWLGQLRLLFALTDDKGKYRELAYVRLYADYDRREGLDATTCRHLKWAVRRLSSGRVQPHYEVIELDNILRTVYIVPDFELVEGRAFYLNRFKWWPSSKIAP